MRHDFSKMSLKEIGKQSREQERGDLILALLKN